MWYIDLVEKDLVPDWLLRFAIRTGLTLGHWRRERTSMEARANDRRALLRTFEEGPIALHPDDANIQHYEVPTEFFQLVLGNRLKYSCCYWPEGVGTLDQAEEAMLRLTCQRAQIEDGMDILELGCGWGSLCLWIAEKHPDSRVVAVSNSRTQTEYVDRQASSRMSSMPAIPATGWLRCSSVAARCRLMTCYCTIRRICESLITGASTARTTSVHSALGCAT